MTDDNPKLKNLYDSSLQPLREAPPEQYDFSVSFTFENKDKKLITRHLHLPRQGDMVTVINQLRAFADYLESQLELTPVED